MTKMGGKHPKMDLRFWITAMFHYHHSSTIVNHHGSAIVCPWCKHDTPGFMSGASSLRSLRQGGSAGAWPWFSRNLSSKSRRSRVAFVVWATFPEQKMLIELGLITWPIDNVGHFFLYILCKHVNKEQRSKDQAIYIHMHVYVYINYDTCLHI